MDINAAVTELNQCLQDMEWETAMDCVWEIAAWVNRGGFLPTVSLAPVPLTAPEDVRQAVIKLSWKLSR